MDRGYRRYLAKKAQQKRLKKFLKITNTNQDDWMDKVVSECKNKYPDSQPDIYFKPEPRKKNWA